MANIDPLCVSRKGEFVARSIAGETVLAPVRGQVGDLDAIYNLSEVGAFLWERLDGKTTVRRLVDAVTEAFDVTSDTAERDILKFLRDLQIAGIAEPSGQGGL